VNGNILPGGRSQEPLINGITQEEIATSLNDFTIDVNDIEEPVSPIDGLAVDIVSFFLRGQCVFNLTRSTAKCLTEIMIDIVVRSIHTFTRSLPDDSLHSPLDSIFHLSINNLLLDSKIDSILTNSYGFHAPMEIRFPDITDKLYMVHLPSILNTMSLNTKIRHFFLNPSSKNTFFSSVYFSEFIKPLADKAIYISVYTDEFEVVNPIGTARKVHKLVAVYFSILNFPPTHSSKLTNVWLLALGKQRLMDHVGVNAFFRPIIEMLNLCYYEEVDINHASLPVISCFLSADNLSCHKILGLRQCFSSGFICRHCLIRYENLSLPTPIHVSMRTDQGYHDDYKHRTNGIVSPSPLMEIPYCCLPFFTPPDFLHDCLEGVTHMVTSCALRKLNEEQSIDFINSLISTFPFGFNLPIFTKKHIASMRFPLTASQMMDFYLNLPLVFGHLIAIEPLPKYWELVLLHHELLSILLDVHCHVPPDYISILIYQHNALIYELCDENPKYRCKLHYLTHYSSFFLFFKSLKHMWTMRFEGGHRFFKQLLSATGQFKNVAYTCVKRFLMKACFLMNEIDFSVSIIVSKTLTYRVSDFFLLEEWMSVKALFEDADTIEFDSNCTSTNSLICNGRQYSTKKRTVLVYERCAVEDQPKFAVIEKLVCVSNKWIAICYPYASYYHSHFCTHVLDKPLGSPIAIYIETHSSRPLPVHVVRCCLCVVIY
jgi:hypothetical protein